MPSTIDTLAGNLPALTIEGQQFGRGRALFPDFSFPLPPEWTAPGVSVTLRDLIVRIVREEVQNFQQRRSKRRFLHTLTATQIADGAARGKVDMGGREDEPDADPEQAVATALLAFEDGLYYVFVDNEHRVSLDQTVQLSADSRVTFLRLVALAGG
jgi:hypothetical protein